MFNQEMLTDFIVGLENVTIEKLKDANVTLFKANNKLFAVLEGSSPLRISLRCEPLLAQTLREKYETVMPGVKLNPKYWNTIVLTGQIEWDEIRGFIRHSYSLVND